MTCSTGGDRLMTDGASKSVKESLTTIYLRINGHSKGRPFRLVIIKDLLEDKEIILFIIN